MIGPGGSTIPFGRQSNQSKLAIGHDQSSLAFRLKIQSSPGDGELFLRQQPNARGPVLTNRQHPVSLRAETGKNHVLAVMQHRTTNPSRLGIQEENAELKIRNHQSMSIRTELDAPRHAGEFKGQGEEIRAIGRIPDPQRPIEAGGDNA